MTKTLLLLLLIAAIHGMGVTMNNALRKQVVIDFKDALVPIISKKVSTIHVPDIKSKSHGFHVHISQIEIHVSPISPNQIGVQFNAPSELIFSANSLAMTGSAKIHASLKFIKKTMHAHASISHIEFATHIGLLSVNGKPNISIKKLDLSISSHHVSIKFSGGVIGKIVNFVIDIFKKKIVNHVVDSLKKSIPKELTSKINHLLNSLPSDIKLTPKISMKYNFPHAPVIESDYLFTEIMAYLHPTTGPENFTCTPKPMPKLDAKTQKGLQFFLSDCVVKSALDTAQKLNLMFLIVNKPIKGHQVLMECKTVKVPDFTFKTAIESVGAGVCAVTLDNDASKKFTMEMEIHLRLSEFVKNAIVYFKGDKLEFSKLIFHTPKPIDIEWFKAAMNEVIAAVLMALNSELGTKGIPLPTMEEIDYSDFVQYVADGYTMLGTTPKFHLKDVPNEVLMTDPGVEFIEIDPQEMETSEEAEFTF